MPLPNRVAPDGSLFADPARGLLFGNRGGRFHDPESRALPQRTHASRQWICCVLAFKGRRRAVWSHGYTELFFCDEVTALAAGHRPCMECRRQEALAYRTALMREAGLVIAPSFPEIDRLLDAQRRVGRHKLAHHLPADDLPDGAMIADGARWLAIRGGNAWSGLPAAIAPLSPARRESYPCSRRPRRWQRWPMATGRSGIRARTGSQDHPDNRLDLSQRAQETRGSDQDHTGRPRLPVSLRARGTFGTGAALPPHYRHHHTGGAPMRSIALWLLGVPIPIIILLWFFLR